MKTNYFLKILGICFIIEEFRGCAPIVYTFYNKETNPSPVSIAVLKKDPNLLVDIALIEFDGRKNIVKNWNRYGNKINGGFRIEMLPGEHNAVVTFAGLISKYVSQNIAFKAEAGKTYIIRHKTTETIIDYKIMPDKTQKTFKQDTRFWIEEENKTPKSK